MPSQLLSDGSSTNANHKKEHLENNNNNNSTTPASTEKANDKKKSSSSEIDTNELLIQSMDDPMRFWSTWSDRRHKCLESQSKNGTQRGCNCFEGLGSVM